MACKSFGSLEPFKTFQSCKKPFLFSTSHRRCSGCRTKRSLTSNSLFEEFPRVSFGKLLFTIYFFSAEDSQRKISKHLILNPNLVSRILRRLQDVCSRDLQKKANHALWRTRNCVTIWFDSSSITRVVTQVRVTYIELGYPGTNIDLSRFIISGRLSSSSHLYRARFPRNKYWSVISKAFLNETNEDG